MILWQIRLRINIDEFKKSFSSIKQTTSLIVLLLLFTWMFRKVWDIETRLSCHSYMVFWSTHIHDRSKVDAIDLNECDTS